MHLNAKLIEMDCRSLISSFLVILVRKVYMCQVFGASLLSFPVATAALICGQMMTPPLKLLLKLINRKRNQHQISVINHLFIYLFILSPLPYKHYAWATLTVSSRSQERHIHMYNEHILPTSLQYTNRIVFHLLALHEPH